tara:strand:- start:1207 stop:2847 length:1641 start_codon:yes stop_codon:yes gene_type:complete
MAEIKEKKGLMAAQNNEDTQGDPVQRLRSQVFNQDPDKDTGPLNLSRGMNAVAKALIKYGVTKIGSPGEQIGAMEFVQKNYEDQLELAEKFLQKQIDEDVDERKKIKARAATITEMDRKLKETGLEVLKDPDVKRYLKKAGADLSNPFLAQALGKRYENMRSKLSFTHETAVATLANQAYAANKNGTVPFKDDIEAISKLRVDPTDETERMLAQEQSKKPEGFLDRFADASDPKAQVQRVTATLRANRPPLQTPRTLEGSSSQPDVFGAVSGPDRKRLRDGASNVIAAANNARINRDITGKEDIKGGSKNVNTVKKLQAVVELIIDAGYKAGDDSKLGQDAILIGELAKSRVPDEAKNQQALFNTEISKITTGLRGLDKFEQREFIKELRKDPNLKTFMSNKAGRIETDPAQRFQDKFNTTLSELRKNGQVTVEEPGTKDSPNKLVVQIGDLGYRVSVSNGEIVAFDDRPFKIKLKPGQNVKSLVAKSKKKNKLSASEEEIKEGEKFLKQQKNTKPSPKNPSALEEYKKRESQRRLTPVEQFNRDF